MAPAQILDISNENNAKYTHKKFQVKRNYAHKKFGTRLTPTHEIEQTATEQPSVEQTTTAANNVISKSHKKRSSNDLFRPYALNDDTPRKRKHHELQTELSEETALEVKRFAPTPPNTPSPSPPALTPYTAAAPSLYSTYFVQPAPMMLNPCFRLQPYQFNAQTFAVILQKQRAALYMGAILKRQANLHMSNLMGQ